MPSEQLPLFRRPRTRTGTRPLAAPLSSEPLEPLSSLAAAIAAFHGYMLRQGLSHHTVLAFGSDLKLFSNYVGSNVPLGEISSHTINRFLDYLRFERGVPCKPKSFQRRLTTLKVFFAWLKDTGVIAEDPAAPIAHLPVTSPLPQILYADQVGLLLDAARQLRRGQKPDVRPYLLLTLLLATGIKKSEAMAIRLQDIDLSNPEQGTLFIRYEDVRRRKKERKLRLPSEFAAVLREYREQYRPGEHLFECTARNLEYVLGDLAKMTGLGDTVSFESLRWTCAVQDYEKGLSEDHIRQKLGLSPITWEEAGDKLRRLASKPL